MSFAPQLLNLITSIGDGDGLETLLALTSPPVNCVPPKDFVAGVFAVVTALINLVSTKSQKIEKGKREKHLPSALWLSPRHHHPQLNCALSPTNQMRHFLLALGFQDSMSFMQRQPGSAMNPNRTAI